MPARDTDFVACSRKRSLSEPARDLSELPPVQPNFVSNIPLRFARSRALCLGIWSRRLLPLTFNATFRSRPLLSPICQPPSCRPTTRTHRSSSEPARQEGGQGGKISDQQIGRA